MPPSNDLSQYVKKPLREVELGDRVYWEYKDGTYGKRKAFGKIVGLTTAKRMFGQPKFHVMIDTGDSSYHGQRIIEATRSGSLLVWVYDNGE